MQARLTDSELWDAIRADDSAAFKELFERYWSAIFTTAFSYLHDREACNEITHDIFLNIWLKRSVLHIDNFSHYLRAAARYHIYRYQKKLRAIPLEYPGTIEQLPAVSATNQYDEKLRYTELERQVENYLNALPRRCREIFILSRMEQLSNDEIASRLQISKRTVENQITRALQHLRVSLKDVSALLLLYYGMHK